MNPGESEPGPTGEYPHGELGPDDKGGLDVAVSHGLGRVVIEFGTPVSWVAMTPDEARGIATALIHRAGLCDGKPFTLEL